MTLTADSHTYTSDRVHIRRVDVKHTGLDWSFAFSFGNSRLYLNQAELDDIVTKLSIHTTKPEAS